MAPGLALTVRVKSSCSTMPSSPLDLLGLALEHDRHVDLDRVVRDDLQEVDVDDRPADRVALEVLDDGQVLVSVDLQGDQGVEAGVGGQGGAQVGPLDGDGDGVPAQAVDDGRDLAVPDGRRRERAADPSGAAGLER